MSEAISAAGRTVTVTILDSATVVEGDDAVFRYDLPGSGIVEGWALSGVLEQIEKQAGPLWPNITVVLLAEGGPVAQQAVDIIGRQLVVRGVELSTATGASQLQPPVPTADGDDAAPPAGSTSASNTSGGAPTSVSSASDSAPSSASSASDSAPSSASSTGDIVPVVPPAAVRSHGHSPADTVRAARPYPSSGGRHRLRAEDKRQARRQRRMEAAQQADAAGDDIPELSSGLGPRRVVSRRGIGGISQGLYPGMAAGIAAAVVVLAAVVWALWPAGTSAAHLASTSGQSSLAASLSPSAVPSSAVGVRPTTPSTTSAPPPSTTTLAMPGLRVTVPAGYSYSERNGLYTATGADPLLRLVFAADPLYDVPPELVIAELKNHIEQEQSLHSPQEISGKLHYVEEPGDGSSVQWATWVDGDTQLSVGCHSRAEQTLAHKAACRMATETLRRAGQPEPSSIGGVRVEEFGHVNIVPGSAAVPTPGP